jgi:hypothetical protein
MFIDHRQRGNLQANVILDMPEGWRALPVGTGHGLSGGEWPNQPLRFDSAALRGDHSQK